MSSIMIYMDLIIQIVVVLGVILVSMTLHEVMHGLMAYWLGDNTAKDEGRLTLNPTKHIDPVLTVALPVVLVIMSTMTGGALPIFGGAKPVPFNPNRVRFDEWGAALVALAGPLVNLLIAFLFFGVGILSGVISGVGVESSVAGTIIMTFVGVNLGFFVFNILPIPPLDGSRVVYALAPEFVRRGMEAIEQYGLVVVFAIVMLASSVIGVYMSTAIQFIINVFMTIFAGVAG